MKLPLNIAHRGASEYAQENTLEAVLLAIKQGADMVEVDLHATKDQVLVLSHNDRLSLRHPSLRISKLTYEELLERTGHTYAKLSEVIEKIPRRILINLDLKKTTMDLALQQIITPKEVQKRIYFDSNNAFLLQRYEVFFPEAKSVLNSSVGNPLNLSHSIFAPFLSFLLTLFIGAFTRLIFKRKLNQFFPNYVSLQPRMCNKKNIEFFHTLGISVWVCPVNKEKNMRKFIEMNVDGIKTDKPDILNRVLAEYQNLSQHAN